MESTGDSESLVERQENELQVLQAIYMDDVRDLRENDAWKVLSSQFESARWKRWGPCCLEREMLKVARPPELQMTLKPQESMTNQEIYTSIDLLIKCPVNYPEAVPDIKLSNPKGISNQHVAALKSELDAQAKRFVGEVMILELAQYVQKFLHAHNKPPKKSFYDEMMSNKKRQEEQAAIESKKRLDLIKEKEERQDQKIEEEIKRRQEALREETRRRRSQAKQNFERRSISEGAAQTSELPEGVTPIPKDTEQRLRSSVTPERQNAVAESGSYSKPERRRRTTSTPVRSDSESSADSARCQDHKGVCRLAFNNKKEHVIHRGQCLGHSLRGSTVYAGMDTETGELVTIGEWILQWRSPRRKLKLEEREEDEREASTYLKQVTSIESELMSLLRLHHRNLTHYLGFRHIHHNGTITVHVLSEYVSGGSLSASIGTKMPVPMELVRHYTIQLVDALTYLHGKAVVHKNLRASSVLLDIHGQIRLADYSLDHRLTELYAAIETRRPGVKFVDDKPLVPGRGGKKGDIYMLGLLLLSLAQGCDVVEDVPEVPTSLPQELHDFLNKCLLRDERARWSAAQLQEHIFVNTPIHREIGESQRKKSDSTKAQDQLEDEDEDDPAAFIPFIPTSDGGQSRLKSEFEILRWLGKGGFGDVIKVRNKLDGRFYAIKRIPLNPRSKHFTRKITREVKLLSRLNHENVVRYYNSWIEVSEEPAQSDSMSSTQDTTSSPVRSPAKVNVKNDVRNSLGLSDNIELDVPVAAVGSESIDWSVSMSCSSRAAAAQDSSTSDEDDDEDEDEDENDVFGVSFGASFLPPSDSQDDSIVFDHNSKDEDISQVMDADVESSSHKPGVKNTNISGTPGIDQMNKLQFLYIQMEFCEKSTLRNCIDVGLYQDRDRVWRLFREITEGLNHIHQQGMIHRDLKPVNIFLDSNDHVKIGDFGLATTDIISQEQTNIIELNMTPSMNLDPRVSASKSESLGDGNLTGKVGTALYVSPEMMNTSTRTHYNQKVDIYSLGIMFFEMCYPPLPTGMERVKVLTALRQPDIIIPEDFDIQNDMHNQITIIHWMLNHDPASRPTAEQLLSSELLPPPQLEEAELTEVLRSTISQPDTKAYRHMISAVFGQRIDPATDFTFDIDLHKLQTSFTAGPLLVQRSVSESLRRVFSRHGALQLTTPLLMPKSTLYENCDQYVCMMDYSGGLVSLPYDLRVPFARFIARNNVTSLKRYSIDKVYRQKRIYGLHPKELIECAFDIVTPTPTSLVPDAELIYIINEVIADFPMLQERNYYVRLNHAMLLKGVLLHCGVAEELHQDVFSILGDTRVERQQKLQIQTRLGSLSLSDEAVMKLYRFIETEDQYGKVASMMRSVTKTRGLAASYAKKGLHDMETIINHADAMGSKLQPVLAVGMVYNMHYYSGVTFQVVAKLQRKSRTTIDVLAAGGRYDGLISKVLKPTSTVGHQGVTPSAVGVSISYEKLLAARQEQEESSSMVDVVVCSLGHKPLTREKLSIAAGLWAAGVSTHIVYDFTQSLEEIQELGRHLGAAYTVVLKDLESGYAKVQSIERDKVVEKKVQLSDLPNYLQQKLTSKSDLSESSSSGSKGSSQGSQGTIESWSSGGGSSGGSAGGGSSSNSSSSTSGLPPINISFIPCDNIKMALNTRRRHESQIYSSTNAALSVFSKQCRVEVLAVELTSSVLKTIAANLEVSGDEVAFQQSIGSIVEKHARHRKYLGRIFEEIHELKFGHNSKKSLVIVLYGFKDDSFRILI